MTQIPMNKLPLRHARRVALSSVFEDGSHLDLSARTKRTQASISDQFSTVINLLPEDERTKIKIIPVSIQEGVEVARSFLKPERVSLIKKHSVLLAAFQLGLRKDSFATQAAEVLLPLIDSNVVQIEKIPNDLLRGLDAFGSRDLRAANAIRVALFLRRRKTPQPKPAPIAA